MRCFEKSNSRSSSRTWKRSNRCGSSRKSGKRVLGELDAMRLERGERGANLGLCHGLSPVGMFGSRRIYRLAGDEVAGGAVQRRAPIYLFAFLVVGRWKVALQVHVVVQDA